MHNSGQVKATKYGIPWKLIHEQPVASYKAAYRLEKYYKSGAGRKKLKEIFNNLMPALSGEASPLTR